MESIAQGEVLAENSTLIKHQCDAVNPVPYVYSIETNSTDGTAELQCHLGYRDPQYGDKEPCKSCVNRFHVYF